MKFAGFVLRGEIYDFKIYKKAERGREPQL